MVSFGVIVVKMLGFFLENTKLFTINCEKFNIVVVIRLIRFIQGKGPETIHVQNVGHIQEGSMKMNSHRCV